MAVVMASASRSAHKLISYALDDKPDQRGERYVMASSVGGLLVSVAKQQMRDVRKKWGKDKPGAFVQAYHVIQSFGKDELDPEEPDSWIAAQRIGRALAEDRFPGRHALIVTQRDGKSGCVHNHLVINSIETKTGRSLDSSVVMHSRLVEAHERVLEAEGFEQRADLKQAFSDAKDRRERGEPSGLRRADSTQQSELREFQRYILWEVENEVADEFGATHKPEPFSTTALKSSIERTLADTSATDWASFVEAGRRHHVHIEQRGKKGRGISYGMLREQPDRTVAEPSASDRRRCSSLGLSFEMNAVEQAITRNFGAQQAKAAAVPAVVPAEQLTLVAAPKELAQRKPSAGELMRAMLAEMDDELDANTERMIANHLATKAQEAAAREPSELLPQSERPVTKAAANHEPVAPIREANAGLEAPQPPQEVTATHDAHESTSFGQAAEVSATKLRAEQRSLRSGSSPLSPGQHPRDRLKTPEPRKRKPRFPELIEGIEPVAKEIGQEDEFEG